MKLILEHNSAHTYITLPLVNKKVISPVNAHHREHWEHCTWLSVALCGQRLYGVTPLLLPGAHAPSQRGELVQRALDGQVTDLWAFYLALFILNDTNTRGRQKNRIFVPISEQGLVCATGVPLSACSSGGFPLRKLHNKYMLMKSDTILKSNIIKNVSSYISTSLQAIVSVITFEPYSKKCNSI